MKKNNGKIPISKPYLAKKELRNVIETVKSGWISSKGNFIKEFEKNFAEYCGMKYGIATSNGTASLHLALKLLEIEKGDEVIVPDLTFISVPNTVKYCGAKPILIDSSINYWCIDPEKIEEKLTKKTKAIIVVHLYGHPCDMNPILKIAKKHHLYVIEDCAEAHGAEYNGKKVGFFGDISCFSFYTNKIITTGEGGMCLINNPKLAEKMKILRDHGMDPKKRYWHNVIGFNYRMTNMQAAVGVAQLEEIDKFINKRRKIAKWYSKELSNITNDHLIKLHPQMNWAKCVYWMYSVLVDKNAHISRDNLIKALARQGIETRPFFPSVHLQPCYKEYNNLHFLNSSNISRQGLNLPTYYELTKSNVKYICGILKKELRC